VNCAAALEHPPDAAALDEKQLRVIGLTQTPGAVQEAALGWPEYGEAPSSGASSR
jgi:hypothetical protein